MQTIAVPINTKNKIQDFLSQKSIIPANEPCGKNETMDNFFIHEKIIFLKFNKF